MTPSRGLPTQRDALLAGAVEHVLRTGVATLSLRPLAAALGTSDRMLLYYFGTREALLTAVLEAVGGQLQAHLAAALPPDRLSPPVLLQRADEALRSPAAEAHLRLYIEVSGLAARGTEPHRTVAAAVAGAWLAWLEDRLDSPEAERAATAAGVLATLDGLLLVRFLVSPEVSRTAAGWLLAQWGPGRPSGGGPAGSPPTPRAG